MCQRIAVFLFAVAVFITARSINAAPITYEFIPLAGVYHSSGQSVAVAGTITTDGVMGNIQVSDILSWTFTVTVNGVVTAIASSADPSASVSLPFGSPVATAANLSLPFPPAQPPFETTTGPQITLSDGPTANSYLLTFGVQAASINPPVFQTLWTDNASLTHDTSESSDSAGFVSGSTTTQPTMPFVIATAVPEPSTVALAAVGGLALLMRFRSLAAHRRER